MTYPRGPPAEPPQTGDLASGRPTGRGRRIVATVKQKRLTWPDFLIR